MVTTASVKGANVGIDAIRYGTGGFLTAGELISAGDGSDNPCTFLGFAGQNDSISNRWGILTSVSGSFELQGKFVIGQDNAGTATLCRFEDSDRNLVIVDTPHAAADFTQLVIDHASTVCNLTNINITALGTTNKGRFIVNSADPEVLVVGGTWTGIGIITLRSNSEFDGTVLRQTDQITLNGALLTGVTIDRNIATAAVVTSSLALLDECTFISDGTGHAVDLGTIASTQAMNWNCSDTGYAATDGSTGNETIRVSVNSGQTLTINVASGASIPTVKNDGTGTVSVVSGQVTTTITVKAATGLAAIQGARVYLEADSGGPLSAGTVIFNTLTDSGGQVSDIRSLASDQPVIGYVRKASSAPYYKQADITGVIDNATGLSLTILMISDE